MSDVNLPSRKKLIAVLTNPQFQVRALPVAVCLLAATPVFAQASGDPWTPAVQVLQQSFTTTIARGLALVAIVVGGLGFAYAEGRSKRLRSAGFRFIGVHLTRPTSLEMRLSVFLSVHVSAAKPRDLWFTSSNAAFSRIKKCAERAIARPLPW